MYCGKCGSFVEDGAQFCAGCGEPMAAQAVGSAAAQPPPFAAGGAAPFGAGGGPGVQPPFAAGGAAPFGAGGGPAYAGAPGAQPSPDMGGIPPSMAGAVAEGAKKFNFRVIGIAACGGVALIVLIIALVAIFGGGNPESVVKRYAESVVKGDINTALKQTAFNIDNLVNEMLEANDMTEREFREQLDDMYGVSSINEMFAQRSEDAMDDLEDQFGRNIKTSATIEDSDKLTRSEMRSRIEDLESSFDSMDVGYESIVNLDKVTEMVDYEVDVTIEGSEDDDTITQTVTAAKIGGKWKVLDDFSMFSSFAY